MSRTASGARRSTRPSQLATGVRTAPVAQDHDEADWIELTDGMLPLREVLEDEVLLNCPLAPVHGLSDCPAGDSFAADAVTRDRKQPFAGLADLLKSRDQE